MDFWRISCTYFCKNPWRNFWSSLIRLFRRVMCKISGKILHGILKGIHRKKTIEILKEICLIHFYCFFICWEILGGIFIGNLRGISIVIPEDTFEEICGIFSERKTNTFLKDSIKKPLWIFLKQMFEDFMRQNS